MRTRRSRGSSLIEVVLTLSVALAVLSGAGAVAKSSNDLATSSGLADGSSRRVQRVLDAFTDEIRRASTGSITRTDGSAFESGSTYRSFRYQRVTGFGGTLQVGPQMMIRYIRANTAPDGVVVRVNGSVEEVLARNVTEFYVTRNGNTFTARVAVRLGGTGDRARTARGTASAQTRNP
jgi:hypothetical protein